MTAPPVFPPERWRAQCFNAVTAHPASGRVQSKSLPTLKNDKTFLNALRAALFFFLHLGLISSYKQRKKKEHKGNVPHNSTFSHSTFCSTIDNIWQVITLSIKKDNFNRLHGCWSKYYLKRSPAPFWYVRAWKDLQAQGNILLTV